MVGGCEFTLLFLLTLVTLLQATSKCSSGPYIYDDSCFHTSQGIGSSLNRMKHVLVLSQVFDLTVIPNPLCFQSSEHKTDMLDYFGWSLDANGCTADDVKKAIPFTDKQGGNNPSLMYINVTNYDEKIQNSANKNRDNDQISKVCHAIHDNEDYISLAQSFGQGQEAGNDLYPQMNRHLATLGNLSKNTVLITRNRYMMEGYVCGRSMIRHNWEAMAKKDEERKIRVHDTSKVTVAFHLRHGDVTTKDINWIDPADVTRSMPLKQGIEVLKNLLGEKSILHRADIALKFYSEGKLSEFSALLEAFPQTEFFLGDAETLPKDIDAMATADVLLASPSSFTSLVSALNMNGVILIDKENPEKFEGIDNAVKQHDIIKGNMEPFNKIFCSQLLYTNLRNKLCGYGNTKEENKRKKDIPRQGFQYGGWFTSMGELHVEIKRLRIKLNEYAHRLNSKVVQNELYSSFKLWKHFMAETRSISCYRNSSIADYRVLEDSDMEKFKNNADLKARHLPICKNEKGNGNGYGNSKGSRNIHLNLQFSHFLRSLSSDMVDKGFYTDVYVVHGPNKKRRTRLEKNLELCNIKKEHVTWEEGFLANKLTDDDRSVFKNGKDSARMCTNIIGDVECENGYQFKPQEMSVALKHVTIIKKIAAKVQAESSTRSNAFQQNSNSISERKFSLIIEDDQFLAKNIKRQILETILQLPDNVGLVMLDDSFFFNNKFYPPKNLLNFPFPRSHERNQSRTVGAYLISDSTAVKFANGGHFLPLYTPVDHQFNYAIKKHNISAHWTFPPITCAGSQGLEEGMSSTTGGTQMDPGDRWHCDACCNRYYNTTTMEELFVLTNKDI
jgi:hypothetical protein